MTAPPTTMMSVDFPSAWASSPSLVHAPMMSSRVSFATPAIVPLARYPCSGRTARTRSCYDLVVAAFLPPDVARLFRDIDPEPVDPRAHRGHGPRGVNQRARKPIV